ncbi:MAG: hypothetical protein QGH73_07725 [Rhodospirillales bacterium]|jgi:hypothetical protein|nr:hypothetical protein [Rhodospirillales bacterium]MDP6646392.1 hypothetical protein [Rhodospirillales bacterium]MDP6841551.1 hypothetical protein [Rhodospirillales bacterium]|tara:strand:+ start:591 stop:713 length:123 start_codon:yes stop_codon:yes gene_type:complete
MEATNIGNGKLAMDQIDISSSIPMRGVEDDIAAEIRKMGA